MRIYTKVVIHIETGNVLESESYDYNGPIAECKGGGGSTKTEYVQSPEARKLYEAALPLALRATNAGLAGNPLWKTGSVDSGYLNLFPTSPYEVGGAEQLLYQPGMLSQDVITGLQQPYLDYVGNAVEQFGGGYGSARGGISGAGQELFTNVMQETAPQLALATQQMVSPALQTAYGAQVGAQQAAFGGQLAQAQAGAQEALTEYSASQAAMGAPYSFMSGVATSNVPTAVQQPQGGKK